MYMNNYQKLIKNIEKRYNLMCILFKYTHLSYFNKKKYLYNKLLIYCYSLLK